MESDKRKHKSNNTNIHSLLFETIVNDDFFTAEKLIEKGANPNYRNKQWGITTFHMAVSSSVPLWLTQFMINHGARVNTRSTEYPSTYILHDSIVRDNDDNIELLLNNAAKPNAKDDDGNTALHMAAAAGYNDIMLILLNNGARIEVKNNSGLTAIDVAGTRDARRFLTGYLLQDEFNEPLTESHMEFLPAEMVHAITKYIQG